MLSREDILQKMFTEFTEKELAKIYITAGAALVLHGIKHFCNDIDISTESYKTIKKIAQYRNLPIYRNKMTYITKLNIGNWCEMFHDTNMIKKYKLGISDDITLIHGIRVDSIPALIGWYDMMSKNRGFEKDHLHLYLVKEKYSEQSRLKPLL